MSHPVYRIITAGIISAAMATLAACGPAPAGGLGPAPRGDTRTSAPTNGAPTAHAGQPSASVPATPPSASSARSISVQAWFTRAGKLFETQRAVPATRSIGKAAITALLAGPNKAEAAAGLVSDIPGGTSLLGLNIAGGVATVDLSRSFTNSASASLVSLRLAQVLYTLTQFSTVTSVHWRINGQDVTTIGGVSVADPQTQAAYANVLPAIIVASPVVGATMTSPVTISGTADVFEAVVSITILDAAGREVARTFTTATCGTGCQGSYSITVAYTVSSAQAGTVEVFERSAKDGAPVNMQTIPVTLAP